MVKAIRVPGGAKLSRSEIDDLTALVQTEGAKGLAYISLSKEGLRSPITKFLSNEEVNGIIERTGAKTGDILLFGADKRESVNKVLGILRDKLGDMLGLKDPDVIAWAWITDFPMYEYNQQEKKIDFSHNPFSMPRGGMKALEAKDPLDIVAYQYDIIANGLELSSGAIRNAFQYGAPPHGGVAPGIERLLMLLFDEPSIREVMAFPKNGAAQDVMMNAPSEVDEKQLKELNIKVIKKK